MLAWASLTHVAFMTRPTLPELRRKFHRIAELSNEERETAALLGLELRASQPSQLIEGLGGFGMAAVYAGAKEGPTVLLRSDMDALPIDESSDSDHASVRAGTSHKCGHDGHMTILAAVARQLQKRAPERGRVVLLFQPAEETGEGARRVLDDPRFGELRPDRACAIHNLPGVELGKVVLRKGPFASASRGMIVGLRGSTSHAAEPHLGRSPVAAVASIAQSFQAAPQRAATLHECVQATVVGLEAGGPAFGTSPGEGRVMATLRAHTQASMERLVEYCERLARAIGQAHDVPATENDPAIVEALERAATRAGLPVEHAEQPFAWSEDFGHFTAACPGALMGLGSGVDQPALHHRDYDFPDELIEPGARLFLEAIEELSKADPGS
jgi:amidohydrolase